MSDPPFSEIFEIKKVVKGGKKISEMSVYQTNQCYVEYGPPYRLLSNQWTYGLGLYFFYLGPLGPRYLGPNGPRYLGPNGPQ